MTEKLPNKLVPQAPPNPKLVPHKNFLHSYLKSSSTSPFTSASRTPNTAQPAGHAKQLKPCEKFGLDTGKLEIEELLKIRSYRRLYNIVANDQTQVQQVFRPNLIKQLYFLLQITPFIEQSLRNGFLNKIQDWYNSNDHKKIQLSKNLDGIIKNVLSEKTRQNQPPKTQKQPRPKTGIQWDKSLNPFLRPYTAKLRSNTSASNNNRKYSRPMTNKVSVDSSSYAGTGTRPCSSKFGNSTQAYTNCFEREKSGWEEIGGDGDMEGNQEVEERELCDIQQEWQRSLDFKKKYRTLHPQQQPTYQKLLNLISTYNPNPKPLEQLTKTEQKKRKIQSAKFARNVSNARVLAERELRAERGAVIDDSAGDNGEGQGQDGGGNQVQFGEDGDDQEVGGDGDDNEEQVVNLNEKYKKFDSDIRCRQGRSPTPNHLYQTLNGTKIVRPFTASQSHIINKLDQYSAIQQNKRVMQSIMDEQCADQFRQYVRKKNMMKREILRKSQAKRCMGDLRAVANLLPGKDGAGMGVKSKMIGSDCGDKDNKPSLVINTVNNQQKQSIKQNNSNELNLGLQKQSQLFTRSNQQNTKNKGNLIDLTNFQQYKILNERKEKPIKNNTYNVKSYFQGQKRSIISASSRGISKIDVDPSLCGLNTFKKMTYQKRLFSEQKFDPMHKNNIQIYNREALEQIQKIKQKFGGQISTSTDVLLKALYIDAPMKNPSKQQNKGSNINNNLNSSRLILPDKAYLMVQKQQKKKKKRKIKKGKNVKSLSKSRK